VNAAGSTQYNHSRFVQESSSKRARHRRQPPHTTPTSVQSIPAGARLLLPPPLLLLLLLPLPPPPQPQPLLLLEISYHSTSNRLHHRTSMRQPASRHSQHRAANHKPSVNAGAAANGTQGSEAATKESTEVAT
jgi:hypothetical protein